MENRDDIFEVFELSDHWGKAKNDTGYVINFENKYHNFSIGEKFSKKRLVQEITNFKMILRLQVDEFQRIIFR